MVVHKFLYLCMSAVVDQVLENNQASKRTREREREREREKLPTERKKTKTENKLSI